jgi:hypothetical protein
MPTLQQFLECRTCQQANDHLAALEDQVDLVDPADLVDQEAPEDQVRNLTLNN